MQDSELIKKLYEIDYYLASYIADVDYVDTRIEYVSENLGDLIKEINENCDGVKNVKISPYDKFVLAWRNDLKYWIIAKRTSHKTPDNDLIQIWEMREWIDVKEELPLVDGSYEVTNHPEKPFDLGVCEYNGLGFIADRIYRNPKYWRYMHNLEKKYGKQK